MSGARQGGITLVLGGARSGKTAHALMCAEAAAPKRVYIATAEPLDSEMADRIARHRAERGAGWRTLEAATDLTGALAGLAAGEAALIDCLTLWLSNLMHAGRDIDADVAALLAALRDTGAPVVIVSNEVGMGLVPDTPLGRAFRDRQGQLNQQVAAVAGQVVFVAAGMPLPLKG